MVSKEFNKEMEKYIISDDENYYFDVDLAKKNKEDEDMIAVGEIFNTISNNFLGTDFSIELDSEDFTTLGLVDDIKNLGSYGNFCGPGHTGGNPIDALDYACARHDACYGQRGWGNATCNKNFVNEIDRIRNSSSWGKIGRFGQLYALAARALFSRFM